MMNRHEPAAMRCSGSHARHSNVSRYFIWYMVTLIASFICYTVPLRAAEIFVTQETWQDTAVNAGPGDVILFQGGSYPLLTINASTSGMPGNPITFRSADPSDPARFRSLRVDRAKHIVIEDIIFEYHFMPGDVPNRVYPFAVNNSGDVTIRRCVFEGDKPYGTNSEHDGYAAGRGLGMGYLDGLILENNTFRGFYRGMSLVKSTNIRMKNNDIYGMLSDGINFVEVQNMRVEGNYMHDFNRGPESGAHPDMIQFWSTGAKTPSANISIVNNIFYAGRGNYTQTIFMRNEAVDVGGGGYEMYYRDITISGNIIINSHLHGITLGEADGVTVENNTLLHSFTSINPLYPSGHSIATPIISMNPVSRNVTIRNNIVAGVSGATPRPDWHLENNLPIDAYSRASNLYYTNFFQIKRPPKSMEIDDYTYKEGVITDGVRYGSPLLRADRIKNLLKNAGAPAAILAAASHYTAAENTIVPEEEITVTRVPHFSNRFRLTEGRPKSLRASGQEPTWKIGEGTEHTGLGVEVDLPPGQYSVTLTYPDETSHTANIEVADPHIFSLEGGVTTGPGIVDGFQPMRTISTPTGVAAILGGKSTPKISGAEITNISGAGYIELGMRLKSQPGVATPGGIIAEIPSRLTLAVTNSGIIVLTLQTHKERPVQLLSPSLPLHNGKWHDLRVTYSAASESLELYVGARLVARTKAKGMLHSYNVGSFNLGAGNVERNTSFRGFVSDVHLYAKLGESAPTNGKIIMRALP